MTDKITFAVIRVILYKLRNKIVSSKTGTDSFYQHEFRVAVTYCWDLTVPSRRYFRIKYVQSYRKTKQTNKQKKNNGHLQSTFILSCCFEGNEGFLDVSVSLL